MDRTIHLPTTARLPLDEGFLGFRFALHCDPAWADGEEVYLRRDGRVIACVSVADIRAAGDAGIPADRLIDLRRPLGLLIESPVDAIGLQCDAVMLWDFEDSSGVTDSRFEHSDQLFPVAFFERQMRFNRRWFDIAHPYATRTERYARYVPANIQCFAAAKLLNYLIDGLGFDCDSAAPAIYDAVGRGQPITPRMLAAAYPEPTIQPAPQEVPT